MFPDWISGLRFQFDPSSFFPHPECSWKGPVQKIGMPYSGHLMRAWPEYWARWKKPGYWERLKPEGEEMMRWLDGISSSEHTVSSRVVKDRKSNYAAHGVWGVRTWLREWTAITSNPQRASWSILFFFLYCGLSTIGQPASSVLFPFVCWAFLSSLQLSYCRPVLEMNLAHPLCINVPTQVHSPAQDWIWRQETNHRKSSGMHHAQCPILVLLTWVWHFHTHSSSYQTPHDTSGRSQTQAALTWLCAFSVLKERIYIWFNNVPQT